MKNGIAALLSAALLSATCCPALAHTGGPLDDQGCHPDRRKGDYHCHLGELRGLTFTSRKAMLDAVESGNLPARPERESFFSRLWPRSKRKDAAELEASPAPQPEHSPAHAQEADLAQPAPLLPQASPPSDDAQDEAPAPTAPSRAPAPPPPVASPDQASSVKRSFEERLRTLSGLRQKGLITEREYQSRRQAILDEI